MDRNVPSRDADHPMPTLIVICSPVAGDWAQPDLSHPPIDGWREWRRVCDAVSGAWSASSGEVPPLRISRLHPASPDNLRRALHSSQAKPVFPMVHLIGYVPDDGRLRMERGNGCEEPVSPDALSQIFDGAKTNLVLLNICHGEPYGRALLGVGVASVVTARGAISDPEAALVARELYSRLCHGESVGDACDWVRRSIVQGYERQTLPPISEWDLRQAGSRRAYGESRADNILLLGNDATRLGSTQAGDVAPEFDLGEPPHNVPFPDTFFAGRGSELVQLSDVMEEERYRAIALSGVGGVGKSALALAAALHNSWRYQGVFYLQPRSRADGRTRLPLEDVCGVVDTVLGSAGRLNSITDRGAKRQRLAEILNRRPYLLIFDNLDGLEKEDAEDLAHSLRRVDQRSGTLVLFTLRQEGLPPLIDPDAADVFRMNVNHLRRADAVLLLVELLLPSRQDLGDVDAVEAWDKIPVASKDVPQLPVIEEAYPEAVGKIDALYELAEAAFWHPPLLRYMAAEMRRPERGWHDLLAQLKNLEGQDLRAKLDSMIGRICRELKDRKDGALDLLQAASAFSPGAALPELRAVWQGAGQPGARLVEFDDAFQAARATALLEFAGGRVKPVPLAREYLRRNVVLESAGHQSWPEHHALRFVDFARSRGSDHDAMESERLNLLEAVDTAERLARHAVVTELVRCMAPFLYARGYLTEGQALLQRGVVATRQAKDQRNEAYCHYEFGVFSAATGNYENAEESYLKSLRLKEGLEDLPGLSRTYQALAALAVERNRPEDAERWFRRGQHVEKELPPSREKVASKITFGALLRGMGRFDEARSCFEEILDMAAEIDDDRGRGVALHHLGEMHLQRGEFSRARQLITESLDIKKRQEDAVGELASLYGLALVDRLTGKASHARDLHEQALQRIEVFPSAYWKMRHLDGAGRCSQLLDDYSKARDAFIPALQLAEELDASLAIDIRKQLNSLHP